MEFNFYFYFHHFYFRLDMRKTKDDDGFLGGDRGSEGGGAMRRDLGMKR